ncbi:MAG TPA: DUF72 domain-containing protein [Acidimicrobiales bacterium]|nr:DUF72 domain-containing protein [Acidimicrobiales bacterium]
MGILVGTSSWTDPTLVRDTDFYPPGVTSAEERLRHYASIFPVVEVDSTFYAPPSPDVARLWVERTPPGFRMEIKSYGLFTGHPVRPATLWRDLREEVPAEHRDKTNVYGEHLPGEVLDEAWVRFDDALRPLHAAGKLGAVVFQWPPWFTAKRANREQLEGLRDRLPHYGIAVEFRHGSWLSEKDRDRTLALLAEHDLTYVCVDEPQGFKTSVPPVVAATTDDLALVRFHGHNADNWQRKGITAAERFRYLYDEEELRAWLGPLKDLAEDVGETHVLMNNCYQDYGVRNAQQLGSLLGEGLQPGAPATSATLPTLAE